MTSLSRKSAKTEPFSFCDSTGPRLQLLYRKSYAEKVQEVEKDPNLPEKRMPNVAELADEYERIHDRKRQFAAEYKRARTERNALIRAKDNVRMYMGESREQKPATSCLFLRNMV